MKKFLSTSLSCFACFSAASLLAGPSLDERIDKLEKEMQDVHVTNVSGTSGAGFAKATDTKSAYRWFANFDVLYWRARVGGTEWVLVTDSAVFPFQGFLQDADGDWDWGFKVGLGTLFDHDNWSLGFEYTRLRTSASSKVSQDFTTPTGTDAPIGNAGPSGSSSGGFTNGINYDNLTLNLGKAFFVSSKLSFNPHMGLQTSWIKQNQRLYTTSYINASETFLPTSGTVDTNLSARCDFWGIGPNLGTDLSWFLSDNFKIIGAIEGAILQSYFKVDQNQWIGVTPDGSDQVTATSDIVGNTRKYIPFSRMLIGLGYGTYVRQGQNYFDISLSYEVNYYWRVNQFLNIEDSSPATVNLSETQPVRLSLNRLSEDLGFYGVTLKLGYQF